ncbi:MULTISPECIES: trypsin-like peptidase domain-containing protein [Streptomyces]|uniref:trypsin-like peptidase domain-containing protein n=1 Tax=Streptomyces TaxID=1883 RepID=UPI002F93A7CD
MADEQQSQPTPPRRTEPVDAPAAAPPSPTPPAEPGPSAPTEPGPLPPAESGPVVPAEPGPVPPAEPGPSTPAESGPVLPAESGPVAPAEPGPVGPAEFGPVSEAEPGPVPPSGAGPVSLAKDGPLPAAGSGERRADARPVPPAALAAAPAGAPEEPPAAPGPAVIPAQGGPAVAAGDESGPAEAGRRAYDPWQAGAFSVPDQGAAARGTVVRLRHAVALGLGIALLAGGIGGWLGVLAERRSSTRLELPQAAAESNDRAPGSVAGIAATALPGVVTLHVRGSGGGSGGGGTGTGFVLDGQGHILTNHHVVAGAKDVTVTFSTGESTTASVVGRDSGYDLAVVRVTGVRGLKPLALGNSDGVRVGDPVVAIGAPFDLSNTVTAGIISATGRPITAGGDKDGSDISYVDALQTDAPINPGNSGGPLLDAQGRVIGINSAIRGAEKTGSDRQSGSIGLGFAIPVNQGKRVAEELIRTGRATHPVIGVTLDMQYTGAGARVGAQGEGGRPAVTPGGPAARAGVRPGDVITEVDGVRVYGGDELIVKVRARRPGDPLRLTLLRDGREQTVRLVLGSAEGS